MESESMTVGTHKTPSQKMQEYREARDAHARARHDAQYVRGPQIAALQSKLRELAERRNRYDRFLWARMMLNTIKSDTSKTRIATALEERIAALTELRMASGDISISDEETELASYARRFEGNRTPDHLVMAMLGTFSFWHDKLRQEFPDHEEIERHHDPSVKLRAGDVGKATAEVEKARAALASARHLAGVLTDEDLRKLDQEHRAARERMEEATRAFEVVDAKAKRINRAADALDCAATRKREAEKAHAVVCARRDEHLATAFDPACIDAAEEDIRREIKTLGNPKADADAAAELHNQAASAAGTRYAAYPDL